MPGALRSLGISYRVRHPGVSFRLLADIELQLPALLAVSAQAPKFKRTDFGNLAVEMNGYGAAFTAGGFQSSGQRIQFLNLAFPFVNDCPHGITATDAGAQEAKFSRLAHDQAELLLRHVALGSFFHAKGNHTKRLERRRAAR